jgi:predicted permease
MRAFWARLRDATRRRAIAREFAEEREFHLAELQRHYAERGASPEEARAAAAREFGNVLRAQEELRAQAGFPTWDELVNDFRHAGRGVVRRPWLAGSVIVILTLGLGAAATIHGLIDAVFLRPLPVPHPEELYAVVSPQPGIPDCLSRGTVRRLEAALPDQSVAAYSGGERCTVQIGSLAASRANSRLVNGSFFPALGVAPGAGRLLADSDDRPGAPTDVVVASDVWAKKNFGAPEAALGRELMVNRTAVTIVGVLPRGFREVAVGQLTDLWFATASFPGLRTYGNASITEGDDRPNDPDWNREERVSWLQILLRVRPGDPGPSTALQRAWAPQRDDLALSFDDPREREEMMHRSWSLVRSPGGQSRFRDSFHATGWLLGGVVVVMLVFVCANVSGFLLIRSMSRHREIGVRLALGAGSFRVVRLGFFESVILSLAGGVGGWFLAAWLLPSAVRLLAPGQDLVVGLGLRSALVLTALALISAALGALAPALWISRVQPLQVLSGGRGLGRAPIRLSRVLIVAQFAMAVTLVALATALGDELHRALTADPGFERDRVETALFDPASAGYTQTATLPLMERLQNSALSVPGVTAVGFSANGILAGSRSRSGIYLRDPQARIHQSQIQPDAISPGYLGVVGIPLLRGRGLAESDRSGSLPVAVISAALAREVFGDRDPIGQSFGFDAKPSKADWTIVGVVADVCANGVREPAPPMFYTPLAQWSDAEPEFLAIRFEGREAAMQPSLQAALARTEPGLVLTSWKTLESRMTDDLSRDVATSRLAAIFGGCAVLLAGAAIAGSLGYLVVLRQRELALRMALGVSPNRMLRSVIADSLRLSALGGGLGIAAAWLLPLLAPVKAVLHGQPGIGPALIAVSICLATATVAGLIPARRASRIDPILLLKSE